MHRKELEAIKKAVNEALEIGTDETRKAYCAQTPGQYQEISVALNYVGKPHIETPSAARIFDAVKEGKTAEQISQEFSLPLHFVQAMTGLHEAFPAKFLKKKNGEEGKEFKGDEKGKEKSKKAKKNNGDEEGGDDEDGDGDEDEDDKKNFGGFGDKNQKDEKENGKPSFLKKAGKNGNGKDDFTHATSPSDDGGEEPEADTDDDGDEEGNMIKLDKPDDKVVVSPDLNADDEPDKNIDTKAVKKEKEPVTKTFGAKEKEEGEDDDPRNFGKAWDKFGKGKKGEEEKDEAEEDDEDDENEDEEEEGEEQPKFLKKKNGNGEKETPPKKAKGKKKFPFLKSKNVREKLNNVKEADDRLLKNAEYSRDRGPGMWGDSKKDMGWEYEATHLRDGNYAVRPKNHLGTHGWIEGKPWSVVYVKAKNPKDALLKAAIARQRGKKNGVQEAFPPHWLRPPPKGLGYKRPDLSDEEEEKVKQHVRDRYMHDRKELKAVKKAVRKAIRHGK